MNFEQKISDAFPFESKFIEINGSKLHYIDEGEGDPIVFIHGIPTSTYLWRNIIPTLKTNARCIAVDLIGFGLSDKPDINYSVDDHIHYFNEFVSRLNLKNISFVMHGFGSIIGFNYFAQFENNVKSLAFYESYLYPETDWHKLSLPVQQLGALMRKTNSLEKSILEDNYFLRKIFPLGMLHLPDRVVLNKYYEPFALPEHRRPLLQFVQELPMGNPNSKTARIINEYANVLTNSNIPKLMLYSMPGFLTTIDMVTWCRDNLKNLQLIDLGEELHFAQETMPKYFAQILSKWFDGIN